jgi:hypothetical protein
MKLPYLPNTANNKIKKQTIRFLGLNRQTSIKDEEFSATTNLSTDEFPLISPRPSRSVAYTLSAGHALFAA